MTKAQAVPGERVFSLLRDTTVVSVVHLANESTSPSTCFHLQKWFCWRKHVKQKLWFVHTPFDDIFSTAEPSINVI